MSSTLQFRIAAGGSSSASGSVLAGGDTGTRGIHRFGSNPATGAVFETVWPVGDLYPFPTAATQVRVAAGHADDDVGGIGAITVTVEGLDADGVEISSTLQTNGTSPGTEISSFSFWRINNVEVASVGDAGHNVGPVSIENSTGGTTLGHIFAAHGASDTWRQPRRRGAPDGVICR